MNRLTKVAPADGVHPLAPSATTSVSNRSRLVSGIDSPGQPSALSATATATVSAGNQNEGTAGETAPVFGPPTTHRMTGAGGPFNDYDCKIAKARARGDEKAARELQQARARINLAFGLLEPVWVPTQSQLAIGMMMRVAEVDGVCTLDAYGDDDDGFVYVERIAPGSIAV